MSGRVSTDRSTWPCLVMVMVVVLLPQLAIQAFVPELRTWQAAAWVAGLILHPVFSVSGLFLYLHWRLTLAPTGWLAAGLLVVGTHGMIGTALELSAPNQPVLQPGWWVLSDLLVIATLGGLVLLGWRRAAPKVDPAALGIGLGMVLSAAQLGISAAIDRPMPSLVSWLLAGLVGLLGVGVALAVSQVRAVAVRERTLLFGAVLALVLYRALLTPTPGASRLDEVNATVFAAVAACLVALASVTLVRRAIDSDLLTIRALNGRLVDLEGSLRSDRAVLHELRNSMSAIAHASHLTQEVRISPPDRQALTEMLAKETARLNRLVHPHAPLPLVPFDVDDVLRPLVVAHRTKGHEVVWWSSHHRVLAQPDELAEVVSILLDNAGKHARGGPAVIDVRSMPGRIEIAVSDCGPGIPVEVSASVFEWGARGPASNGEGIGLHRARQLLLARGHSLSLESVPGRGARFVIGLPAASPQGGAASRVAQ